MKNTAVIFLNAMLTNNFVLTKFLGLCPVFGVTQQLRATVGMAFATILVLSITAVVTQFIWQFVLIPLNLIWMQVIVAIVLIAAIVQITEMLFRIFSPLLHKVLGIYLPLITTNCAVLGMSLLSMQTTLSFTQALMFGLGTGAGFGIIIILFASIREKLKDAAIPKIFQGQAIAMITLAIMSMAMMGFNGLIF